MEDFDSKETVFLHVSSQTLVQISQRGCGGSIPIDIQNSTVHGPEQSQWLMLL